MHSTHFQISYQKNKIKKNTPKNKKKVQFKLQKKDFII